MAQVLSPEFLQQILSENIRLKPNWTLRLILPEDFQPREDKLKEAIPSCDQYVVYEF